jgi:hypothetical protein
MTGDGGDDEANETWLESSGRRERMTEAAPVACRATRPDTAAFLMYESSSRKSADASARKNVVRCEEVLMEIGCRGQSAVHTGQLGDGILPRNVILVVQPCRALGVGSDHRLARWCRREEEALDGDQPDKEEEEEATCTVIGDLAIGELGLEQLLRLGQLRVAQPAETSVTRPFTPDAGQDTAC